ncbi:hypothetical protein E2C01_049206 [Portunus trituberculatus]|uniref:Uncharacterized protein n=1 Tax=Portunus trituberculatus TaxID=210409 RepID=A0A5B7GDA8_PORTR|nr:hypothetical protein [Portunus trituberculatus]
MLSASHEVMALRMHLSCFFDERTCKRQQHQLITLVIPPAVLCLNAPCLCEQQGRGGEGLLSLGAVLVAWLTVPPHFKHLKT